MSVYINTNLVTPPYYQKIVNVYTAFTSPMKILNRDNRRVKVIIGMFSLFSVSTPFITFDGSSLSGGAVNITDPTNFQMEWNTYFSLVQSEMWITGINTGTSLVVTSVIAQNTQRERSRDAIDTIRLASEKIKDISFQHSSSAWKLQPNSNLR